MKDYILSLVRGFLIVAAIGWVTVAVWNVLVWAFFNQWYRYQGCTLKSAYYGFLCFLVAFGPIVVGAHTGNHALFLICLISWPVVLVCLRMETLAYLNEMTERLRYLIQLRDSQHEHVQG